MSTAPLQPPALQQRPVLGRTFVHPAFDYLVIGGGLSLLATAAVWWAPGGLASAAVAVWLPPLLFACNLAHFAASTVRLYSKPGAFRSHAFLTMSLPLLTLIVLWLAIRFADLVGVHVMNLYLTWSPYHYAAQAYGLALMYGYRSGSEITDRDKTLVRACCLAPFLYAFVKGPGVGLAWFLPASWLALPLVAECRSVLVQGLAAASVAAPVALVARARWSGRPLPPISFLVIFSNAVWWVGLLGYLNAFGLATIFHGLQYMAIVMIFHVRERLALPGNRHGWAFHAAGFYLACVALAYLLFQAWPFAFVAAGFGLAESMLLVVAVINIHHFVVDAYIWRLRRDPNYRIVTDAAPAAA